MVGTIGSLRGHALAYASQGLEVFPLHPDKTPRTPNGMKDATTSLAQVESWWELWPEALIGCRVPEAFLLFDIDPKHGGIGTWVALKDTFGELPTTRVHKSGRGDGGGHLWFRRPPGRLSVRGLNRWAKEHGVGAPAGKQSWISGVDLLSWHHRYTILPPSPHPVTGLPYQWLTGRGLDTEPAKLPPWLAELVTAEPEPKPPPPRPSRPQAGDDSIADWFSSTFGFGDLLTPEGWGLVAGDGDSDGSRWRHPNATASYSASVKNGCLFVYSTGTDFEPTEEGGPHGYTPFRAYATLAHGGDLAAAARAARYLKDGDRSAEGGREDWSFVGTLTGGCGPDLTISISSVAVCGPEGEAAALDDLAWPELGAAALHGPLGDIVAGLADQTEADPAGVLAGLLVYFGCAAGAGPHFRLSGGKHTARLNMLVVGDTARARKGSAEGMARWVMGNVDPAITTARRMNGLNSGEGLIEAVRDPKWGRDGKGNDVLVDEGVSDKRLFLYEPELAGRLLPAIKRTGSTISGLLRMAWDEGDLQTMNAKNPLRATGAHVCVLGNATVGELMAGISPADIEGGLLNRFLFVAVRSGRRLPFGGGITDSEVEELSRPLRRSLEASRRRQRIDFGDSGRESWPGTYDALMDDAPDGPLGHLTARGPIQVQRLALVYALADSAAAIEATHLDAALAFWAYARASAELVLGVEASATGDTAGDDLLRLLVSTGRPWSARQLQLQFRWSGSKVAAVRARLEKAGMVRVQHSPTPGGGRPTTWVEVR
jgi:hypothetical protein